MQIEYEIGEFLIKNKLTISTAESCTGGLLSSRLTDVPGSSQYITYNAVTYSNSVKHKLLNVSENTLLVHGAVSTECAKEMVLGLKNITNSDICVSTTGIAGPAGGSSIKPVGLCYIGVLYKSIDIIEIKLPSQIPRIKMKYLFTTEALKFIKQILHF